MGTRIRCVYFVCIYLLNLFANLWAWVKWRIVMVDLSCQDLHSFICPRILWQFPQYFWLGENFEVLRFVNGWVSPVFLKQCVIFLYLFFYLLIALGYYSWFQRKHCTANWNMLINIDLMILITYCWSLSHLHLSFILFWSLKDYCIALIENLYLHFFSIINRCFALKCRD